MPASLEEILSRIERDLVALQREATEIRVRLALNAEPKFYMSLYALIMGVFSQVDLLATIWSGKSAGDTGSMRRLLRTYTAYRPLAIDLAIQLYRNTLMHTGRPRELINRRTGERHYFLLHWGREHADPSAHFTVSEEGNLTLNLECLVEDLIGIFSGFARDAKSDSAVNGRVMHSWPRIALQDFSPPAA